MLYHSQNTILDLIHQQRISSELKDSKFMCSLYVSFSFCTNINRLILGFKGRSILRQTCILYYCAMITLHQILSCWIFVTVSGVLRGGFPTPLCFCHRSCSLPILTDSCVVLVACIVAFIVL